jgi:hypothetical protein
VNQKVQKHKELGDFIVEETIDRARGRNKEYCLFERPRRNFFVSNLSPQQAAEADEYSESRPASIGLRIKPDGKVYEFKVTMDFFVRSYPNESEFNEIREREFEESSLFFRRFSLEYHTELNLAQKETEEERITSEVNDLISEEFEEFSEDILVFPKSINLEDEVIEDKQQLNSIREKISQKEVLNPEWSVELDISEEGNERYISLTNTSRDDKESKLTDNFIFNPKITLRGDFNKYTLASIPEDYRYNQKIWGKGQNCSISVDNSEQPSKLETTAVPKKQLYRFVHNKEFSEYIGLNKLSSDGAVQALRNIESEMRKYLSEWRNSRKREMKEELTNKEIISYEQAADKFEDEIDNFSRGIDVLEKDEILKAFKLMNKSFEIQDNKIESWRLFQIVFIVSNLASIASREHEDIESRYDEAEVLWFPTGGGKTEAYLGLIITTLFFDRIRGKNKGVSAWIRFPLRLLGRQQKERTLGILTCAEEIRVNELDAKGEEFSLGYFVGGQDTPNKICDVDSRGNDYRKEFTDNPQRVRDECKVIESCPKCGGEIQIKYEREMNSVFHYCTSDCDIEKIPIYVTDNDIYRYVPSVLLGTLDKIAIFTSKCPVHNYGYSGKCSESGTIGCSRDLEGANEEIKDPIPTLHLIDEVHLLEEELGVFAGHYETLYLKLCELIGGVEPKIITSTATISNYDKQMQHLFRKDANRFPEEGPTKDESFYGKIDEDIPERKYLGLTPFNKTHIYAVLDLVKYMQETIRDLRQGELNEFDIPEEEKEEILRMYELSIVYFLKKTDKDRFRRSIKNQIRREMDQEGYDSPIKMEQLTGDTEDLSILDELEQADGDFEDRKDLITATSFISHGIDVERFNNMFFFGFPSETFQYIQSSSRVGREEDIPGYVIDIFKPFNERDKHRFKYFNKTHEYLRRLVEPISLDRWSKRGIDETFPGLFKGLFINYYRPLFYEEFDINLQSSSDLRDVVIESPQDYLIDGKTLRESMKENLRGAYGISNYDGHKFEGEIDDKVDGNWEYWNSTLGEKPWTTFRTNAMRSLRDIGESVPFNVAQEQWELYNYLVGGQNNGQE